MTTRAHQPRHATPPRTSSPWSAVNRRARLSFSMRMTSVRRNGHITGARSHDEAFDARRAHARADVSKTAGRRVDGRVSDGVGTSDIERDPLDGVADLMGVAGPEGDAAASLRELAEALQV